MAGGGGLGGGETLSGEEELGERGLGDQGVIVREAEREMQPGIIRISKKNYIKLR